MDGPLEDYEISAEWSEMYVSIRLVMMTELVIS